MIQKIKKALLGLSLLSLFVVPTLATASAAAQSTDCLNNTSTGSISGCLDSGSCTTDTQGCAANPDATDRVNGIIRLIINIFSLVVGVIAVIMIILGGMKYILSGGDSGSVTGAKNTILFAIVGLVIVALAQIIVRFVLKKVAE